MRVRSRTRFVSSRRAGSILPAVVLAILVCGLALALVLNEYWLSSAQEELRTATQAVALAAGGALVSDDLLKVDPPETQERADRIREAAQQQATRNQVHGPFLPAVDVHLGRVEFDPATGQQHTVETDENPNSIVVVGHRDRSRQNPVAMLAPALAGRAVADVTVTAEASVTNLIEGVRPFGAVDVPAWPIAILEFSSDNSIQSWVRQIEERQGTDQYSWNPENQTVEDEPDGLFEILLQPNGAQGTNNAYIVDLGTDFQEDALRRQFTDGWSAEDLSSFGDLFTLKSGPIELSATNDFSGAPYEELEQQVGQLRILLLYSSASGANPSADELKITRMVAGRLMQISESENGPQIIFQPGVIVTRTGVLDEDALYAGETFGNPYIYKLSITQ